MTSHALWVGTQKRRLVMEEEKAKEEEVGRARGMEGDKGDAYGTMKEYD
jgi:hypothetical protein